MAEKLLTTTEAAERLGVSRQTINSWIDAGRLSVAPTPGTRHRIPESALAAFIPPAPVVAVARVLAVAHHAGGVGKTTTTMNLAYALAQAGQRVCVVDLDPQGDLSKRLGIAPIAPTLGSVLLGGGGAPAVQAIRWGEIGFDLIAADLETMAGVEMGLMGVLNGREQRLRRALAPLRGDYDTLLLDCPPSLSLLMTNALYAADGVLIPVQAHDKAMRQLDQVFATIDDVNDYRDPSSPVRVVGIVLTMVDKRAAMAGEVETGLRATYGDLVFSAMVPLRTDAAADSRYQAPLGVYAPNNAATRAHAALAQEVIARA
jgi:chromosome partitioning protein